MKTRTIKILSAMLVSVVLVFCVGCVASNATAMSPSQFTGNSSVNTGNLTNIGNDVIGIFKIVGMLGAVIVLMILGFKYMMGSAEDKADYKKSMIPYIVGAVILFAAPYLAEMIFKFAGNLK